MNIRRSRTTRSFLFRLLFLAGAGAVILGMAPAGAPRIFLVGDSTMADKPITANPEVGWGQMFPALMKPGVVIENHARNGRSTKSFIDEGRWAAVVSRLAPGDYVLIQFGHNDAKKDDSLRYAAPQTAYRENLVRMVQEARDRGALPVLLTPVNRRKYDEKGAFVDQHGEYPDVVRDVAAREHVPLIDLHARTRELFARLGEEGSKNYFLAGVPEGMYVHQTKLKRDNTHFTKFGAIEMARLVAEGIRKAKLPLASWLKPGSEVKFPAMKKAVLLDNYFNNETRTEHGQTVPFHYLWQDTTNSGFYELGHLFDRQGAECDTLRQAPTGERLKDFGVYIIVDPDTPSETPAPNYMDAASADVIARWVEQGGVLVLMENDKGNAEFEHFNTLAARFGMHFNEVSLHRVEGTQFDQGKSDRLPKHPLFRGVRKIYMKEVSTITVAQPARALLVERGECLMAVARVGKGLVFAVGDPWLYNEYIDNRKLPVSFENYKAAGNLVEWLLSQAPETRK
ncbi:MAG: GDSL-type esterase/lipase family protein [Acidobacteriota bacterium]